MSAFEEAMKKRASRYDEIKHLAGEFKINRIPGYAHYRFEASTDNAEAKLLSAEDVALIVDGGNLCFGGRGFTKREAGDKTIFSGIVHTD